MLGAKLSELRMAIFHGRLQEAPGAVYQTHINRDLRIKCRSGSRFGKCSKMKAINCISICKCAITITIRMLNIIAWGLDLWTVLGTFMSTIGESPSGLYLCQPFPALCLKLSCTSLLAKWDKTTHKTNQPFQFSPIFNALKKWLRLTNWVWGRLADGVECFRGVVCRGWGINGTKTTKCLLHFEALSAKLFDRLAEMSTIVVLDVSQNRRQTVSSLMDLEGKIGSTEGV